MTSITGPEHEGWSNRETWAVARHVDDTEWLLSYALTIVRASEGPPLWDALRDWVDDVVCDAVDPVPALTVEFQLAASSRVNWRELEEHWRAKIKDGAT